MKQNARPTIRRRDVIECHHCGKTAPRTGVAQLFCSARCKHRAARNKRATASGPATPDLKSYSENNALRGTKLARSVPVFLVGGTYRWPGAELDAQTARTLISTEVGGRFIGAAEAEDNNGRS
jgi:hypothetical protein